MLPWPSQPVPKLIPTSAAVTPPAALDETRRFFFFFFTTTPPFCLCFRWVFFLSNRRAAFSGSKSK